MTRLIHTPACRWTLITAAAVILLFAQARTVHAADGLGPLNCERVTSMPAGRMLTGRALRQVDGDTFDLSAMTLGRGEGHCIRVRLTDFDAPERGEPGFDRATQALRRTTAGKVLTCRVERGRNGRTVSYDRVLAKCSTGGVGLGDQMRRAGIREGGR